MQTRKVKQAQGSRDRQTVAKTSLAEAASRREELLGNIRTGSAAWRALQRLRLLKDSGWTADEFISRLKRDDPSLHHAAYNNFRGEAAALGMHRVQAALHLAGIDATPGMNRGTTFDEDLSVLLGRLDNGRSITEKSVRADDSRLFNRLKVRAAVALRDELRGAARASWKAVAYCIAKRRPDAHVESYFDHVPEGVYPALPYVGDRWFWSETTTAAKRREVHISLIREMVKEGIRVENLSPDRFSKLSNGAASLYKRVSNDASKAGNWGELVEEATGQAYVADARGRQSGATHVPVGHTLCLPRKSASPGLHPRLRSAEEASVDGLLAILVGKEEYQRAHSHDVPLRTLIGVGGRSSVDIVLFGQDGRRAVVEVTNGRPDQGYQERLLEKTRQLADAGVFAVVLNCELAGARYAQELKSKLLAALDVVGLCPVRAFEEAFEELGRSSRRKDSHLSYQDAVVVARAAGVSGFDDYHRRHRELGLPSNPNLIYKGRGWKGLGEFLGLPLKPGRRKGVVYPRRG